MNSLGFSGVKVDQVVDQSGDGGAQQRHEGNQLPPASYFLQGRVVGREKPLDPGKASLVLLLHCPAGWGGGYDILEILDALFPGFAFFDVAGDPFTVSAVGSVELVELEYDRGIVLGGLLPEERAVASLLFPRKPQFRLQ